MVGTLIDNQLVRFTADVVQLHCSPSKKQLFKKGCFCLKELHPLLSSLYVIAMKEKRRRVKIILSSR